MSKEVRKAPAQKAVKEAPAKVAAKQSPQECFWDIRLKEVAKALEGRNYEVTTVQTLKEAAALVEKKIIPALKPASIGVGGSMTVVGAGLYDVFGNLKKVDFVNPYKAGLSPEEAMEARRKCLVTDLFFTSTNALTREGDLVNLDGFGNRVAGMIFGPRKVVLLVGRNKICDSLDEAQVRVKNTAAPMNTIRLNKKTPCVKTGFCMDCSSPERICNYWSIIERCGIPKRIHVVLINEDLGF